MQTNITQSKIDQLTAGDYDFQTLPPISEGLKIVQNSAGHFIGFTSIYVLVPLITQQIEQLIFGFSVNIVSYFFVALLSPGFFIVTRKIRTRQTHSFKDFFEGHKYATKLLGIYFLMILVKLLPLVPAAVSLFIIDDIIGELTLFMEAAADQDFYLPEIGLISILLLIIGFLTNIYLNISYLMAVPIATFTTLGIWEAMELSRKVTHNKFGLFFLFSIVINCVSGAGILLLGIGMLFTIPISFCAIYIAFETIFQLENKEESDIDLTNHIIA